jgi:predicted dehydrogenase
MPYRTRAPTQSLSFDRYRTALKGTWKDEAGPASGQTYDLGSHLIDQALALFGRPKSITAFIENTRNIGDPDVDDSVGLPDFQINLALMPYFLVYNHPPVPPRDRISATFHGNLACTRSLCSLSPVAI